MRGMVGEVRGLRSGGISEAKERERMPKLTRKEREVNSLVEVARAEAKICYEDGDPCKDARDGREGVEPCLQIGIGCRFRRARASREKTHS